MPDIVLIKRRTRSNIRSFSELQKNENSSMTKNTLFDKITPEEQSNLLKEFDSNNQ